MEFRVVDFEKVTHHYKLYQDGISNIEDYHSHNTRRLAENELIRLLKSIGYTN